MNCDKQYSTRVIGICHGMNNTSINDSDSTILSIRDEGDGEWVQLEQGGNLVGITPEEWPSLQRAIQTMIDKCISSE